MIPAFVFGVVARTGLISRNTIEVNLTKVESVRVSQSILGRVH
jgi:hypothetical protein